MTEDKLKSMASMSFISRLPATDAVDEEAIPRAVEDEEGEDVGVLADTPSTKNRVPTTYRICELYRGLVVHSSAHDNSGNDNHGEIQGAKWAKGKVGSALKFNGSTDRVVIPDSDSLYAKKAWTITSWIFVNKSEVGYGHILGKRSGAGTNYCFRTDSNGVGWDAYFRLGG